MATQRTARGSCRAMLPKREGPVEGSELWFAPVPIVGSCGPRRLRAAVGGCCAAIDCSHVRGWKFALSGLAQ
jgi:hypothetical protein